MQTPKRAIGITTGVVLLLGLAIVIWFTSPTERKRRSLMGSLEVGDSSARVVAVLGEPPARCAAASLGHLATSFPPGWPSASVQSALQRLEGTTAERWIYPVGPRAVRGCAPRDGRTEIGIDRDGRLLWFITVTGKTPLNLPPRITPAGPGAEPASR